MLKLITEHWLFILFTLFVCGVGLYAITQRWRNIKDCILVLLRNANEPLRELDLVHRSSGTLNYGCFDRFLDELTAGGLIEELKLRNDFVEGVPVKRYQITNLGREYVDKRLPVPVS